MALRTIRRCGALAAILGALVFLLPGGSIARAAELVMFEAKGCAVCAMFNREVGPEYHNSAPAKTFPLRRIDLNEGKADFRLEMPVTMTPTFVFVDKGVERARFVGYPGRDVFYQIMQKAVEAFSEQPGAKTD